MKEEFPKTLISVQIFLGHSDGQWLKNAAFLLLSYSINISLIALFLPFLEHCVCYV